MLSIEDVGGWVNHVSFEKNGNGLLVFPHINHFKFYQIQESNSEKGKIDSKEIDVQWNGLPFLSGYMDEKSGNIIAAGYDKKVAVFKPAGSN